jgi:PE family
VSVWGAAAQFGGYGHLYQVVSSQAHTVFNQMVSTLKDNAGTYAATEIANAVTFGS